MHSLPDSTQATKGLSADSLRAAYLSTLENYRGATTPRRSPASRLERISAFLRRPLVFIVAFTLLVLFVYALAFGYIRLISWEIQPEDSNASSTGASLLEKNLDGWTGKRLYF